MKGLLAGLLFGIAAGAALGVMYAPRPGKETREHLAETAGTLKERVKSAPLILVIPIAFQYQYQHQDQIHHHYPEEGSETA